MKISQSAGRLMSCVLLFALMAWGNLPEAFAGHADSVKAKSAQIAQRDKANRVLGAPSFSDVSVHDPSVIRVDDQYYIFGSHLAAARSTDLRHWVLIADGVNEANPLFENVVEELAEVFEWSDAVGLWANEVIQLEDGRFYMYYNLSRLDSPRASMGLAVADHVEGPYVNHGIFLQSGMWDEISEDGENIYDPQIHPNTVDPDAFYDQDGVLWLVYGSYSGGIFILELDPETGFPKPDQGYGKHLMGGNHSRIEGPYIIFSPETNYYYLFVSFGALDSQGGYNVRVARSRDPDGPYFDALGNDMAEVKSNPALPLFDDASIEPYAQKLMGSSFFLRDDAEPGTAGGEGYVSPGHNSAFYDAKSGRYFIIFHTRFPNMGEFHQVRVHEMFMNAEDWPVIAPFRWTPPQYIPWNHAVRAAAERTIYRPRCPQKNHCWNIETVAIGDTPGEYKLINHGKAISSTVNQSERVSLDDDGVISGEYSGTWTRGWGNRITIELHNVGLFVGVMSRGWNSVSQQYVVSFSAQSVEGLSIWGSKLAE